MRDLDIRGAGNLLGDEQSGHVAAVGFELYCQMIDEAVAEASRATTERRGARAGALRRPGRRLPAGRLHPLRGGEDRHPPPHRRRRERRASCARSATSSSDRFGPPPPEAENLLRAAAGADRARPRRRPQRRVPRRPAQRRRGRAGLRAGRRLCASGSRARSTSGASRPSRCACPAIPTARLAAVLALAEALRRGHGERRCARGYAARLVTPARGEQEGSAGEPGSGAVRKPARRQPRPGR